MLIWIAYMAIPFALIFLVRSRRDMVMPYLFWLFGAFIICCGFTHLLEAVTVHEPVYRLSGVWKAVTAVVSLATVAVLLPAIPKLLTLRSPAQLEVEVVRKTEALVAALEGQRRAEESLREIEQRFRLAFEGAPIPMMIRAEDGEVLALNQVWISACGYTREEIPNLRAWTERAYGDGSEETLRLAARLSETSGPAQVGEFHVRTKSGQVRVWDISFATIGRTPDGRKMSLSTAVDVTERKRAEAELHELNQNLERSIESRTEQLREANRILESKNEEIQMFVYSVSHDLRSPLVNLQGYGEELELSLGQLRRLVESHVTDEPTRAEALRIIDTDAAESIGFIRSSATRLAGLIDAILRVSRAGRVSYRTEEVDVTAIVNKVVASSESLIRSVRGEVRSLELPTVFADRMAVEQVFANLIINALNYSDTARPSKIEVGYLGEDEPGWRTFYVRDNGLGIPKEHLERVFQIFQRIHPEHPGGEGVGLTIVHRIVDRLGGRVWVESEPGVGSTFYVRLPSSKGEEGGPDE